MGCDGSITPNPQPNNICGPLDPSDLGANPLEVDISNSCFFTTGEGQYCSSSNIPHGQWCFGQVNQPGQATNPEWQHVGSITQCGVCSSCNGIEQGNGDGSCGFGSGSCTWAGKRFRCQRFAYTGDPLTCCRRSPNINGALYCFQDNTMAQTCNPIYRGFAQDACVPLMEAYCSTDDTEIMVQKWTGSASTQDCLRDVAENAGVLDHYGPVIGAMVQRYLITENKPITSTQTDGANNDPFIQQIIDICRSNPGACDSTLTQKCASVTREQLAGNVNLADLCGCFMPDSEYAKFSQFGVNRVCDPVCVLGTAVKPLDTTTSNPAEFLNCTQSICIIDDVTIQILSNSSTGNITFAQACGSCANNNTAGSCRCYIEDVTLQAVNSLVGDISFQQQCGTPTCYNSNPIVGAPPIQIDCTSGAATGASASSSSSSGLTYIVLGIIILIFIILLLVAYFQNIRNPNNGPIYITPSKPKSRVLIGQISSNNSRSNRLISRNH
jgi:hypothetical protein